MSCLLKVANFSYSMLLSRPLWVTIGNSPKSLDSENQHAYSYHASLFAALYILTFQ